MLLTLFLVKEEPLTEKPDEPLGPPMRRVLGMLAGIAAGGLAGFVAAGIIGGITGLLIWLLGFPQAARAIGIGLGGLIWMAVAVLIGVWSGALISLLGFKPALLRMRDAIKSVFIKKRGKLEIMNGQYSAFIWWVVNRLLFMAAITAIQGFAPYFLMYAFKISIEAATDMTGKLIMVVGIFTLASAIPAGWISDRIGHKKLVTISGGLAALGSLLLLGSIWLPNYTLILLAGCVLGTATGLFVTTNWALGTRIVPAAEAGRYLGISNLAGAGAGMIGSGIGGPVADMLNAVFPGLGYFAIFGSYGILFILSIFSLRGIKLDSA